MKKIIILIILIPGTIVHTFSQMDSKGSIELGGTTDASFAYHFDGNFLIANINPVLGYHFTDNLVIGAGVNIQFLNTESYHNTFYRFGPYARYYFSNKGKLQPFAILQAGSENRVLKTQEYGYGSTRDENAFFWKSGIGLSYWVKPNIALTTELSYRANSLGKFIDRGNLEMNFGVLFKFNTKAE